MANRANLQALLQLTLGSKKVYYQPPASVKMEYPAIIYNLQRIDSRFADDTVYTANRQYNIMYVSRTPDDAVVDRLLAIQHCRFDRYYAADNLHHYSFTIYY